MLRRSLLKLGAGGMMGLPQRPDQYRGETLPALGAGTRANNLRARSLVLSGTGQGVGLFEYSGTPSSSNPPVAYAAPPGVTQDPFGNTLPVTSGGFVSVNPSFMIAALTSAGLRFHHPGIDFGAVIPGLTASGSNALGATVTLDSGSATGATDSQFVLNDSSVGALGRRLVSLITDQLVMQTASASTTTTALLEVQGAIQTSGLNTIAAGGNLQSALGDIFASSGNIKANAAGSGFRAKEGSNAKQGVSTLASGAVIVVNSSVTAVSRIFLTPQDNSTTGALRVSGRSVGVSFTITSSNATDSGVVAWEIFEPA